MFCHMEILKMNVESGGEDGFIALSANRHALCLVK